MGRYCFLSVLLMLISLHTLAATTDFDQQLLSIQQRWAHIIYEIPEPQREKAFEQLAVATERLIQAHPDRARRACFGFMVDPSVYMRRYFLPSLSV